MGFDVARVRGLYASLSDGWTYLNAHELAQIPEKVAAGVATAFRTSPLVSAVEPSSGSHSRAQDAGLATGLAHDASARRAIADLVGASADRVVLGPNREALVRNLVEALAPRLRPTTSVVLARTLDAAVTDTLLRIDAPLLFAEPDLGGGTLPLWQFHELVTGSTRLVVVPAAHGLVGTTTDVAGVADIVRMHSRAWLLVDATALAPYELIDMDAWGADIVLVDCAQLGGPQISALVFRDTSMFPRMKAVNPTCDEGAAKLEVGALSMGLLGGVAPTVEHLANLDEQARGTRRNRLRTSMGHLSHAMQVLTMQLIDSLANLPNVHVVGISGEAAANASDTAHRIPRVSFVLPGVPAHLVRDRLLANGIVAQVSPVDPLLEAMGAVEAGGSVTVSLAPFNTSADVDQLVRAVASLG